MVRGGPLLHTAVVLFLCLCILYVGEIGIHDVYSWTWAWPRHSVLGTHKHLLLKDNNNNFNILNSDNFDSESSSVSPTRILVISDPHIQCTFDLFEPWLFRLDSDLYLKRGLSRLLSRLKPDVVVVLGDVFAEGYKASELHWKEYLQCMRDVLTVPEEVRLVVLPGDNDIGGEGGEGMQARINQRYMSEFGPVNEVVRLKGATLVKLNTVSYIHSSPINEEEAKVRGEMSSFLKTVSESTTRGLFPRPILVFSHVPLSHSSLKSECLLSLKPDYLFSGHTHHVGYTRHTYRTLDGRERAAEERCVPTSSYRMGETHMGAGAIVVDSKGELGYSVMWLPPRYPVLLTYLLLLLTGLALLAYCTLCGNHRPSRLWSR